MLFRETTDIRYKDRNKKYTNTLHEENAEFCYGKQVVPIVTTDFEGLRLFK
jgi:hypothetical protein